MTKEEKLLNMLMGDGASDGEIINARNMLKKMGVKLSIGENSHLEDYINLSRKHANLQGEYQILYSRYTSLCREYDKVKAQQMTSITEPLYEKLNKDLEKKLRDKDMEITALKFYVKIFLSFGSVFAFLSFISLIQRG